ncbi:MAG TPA: polysaccharide pyruvyl transferase family protein [Candidatus Krumholzibacteria bacterium]|nr:polysaccharide pyruvyl transferase family protein [Candidatus Krumholzibacteria bacterium]
MIAVEAPMAVEEVRVERGKPRSARVGLLTPSGWGNLGDAAIQDAVIQAIRRYRPGAEICVFSLNPADTRIRHDIQADLLSGFSVVPGYSVAVGWNEQSEAGSGSESSTTKSSDTPAPGPSLARAALAKLGPQAEELLRRIYYDQAYLRRMRRKLRDFDLVMVSGGGQVDAEWGGAWGHPWTLAKWSLLCRSVGVRFVVLSVGVCALEDSVSRLFARIALRQADFVCFRDVNSLRRALQLHLVEHARVEPDLAFAYDGLDPEHWIEGEKDVVAVGPMAWCDPSVWPRRDEAAHLRYLEGLSEFVVAILQEGKHVLLVSSDNPDIRTVEWVAKKIRAEHPELSSELETPRTETVEEFLQVVSRAETMLASRLHGFLLAAGLGKPVLPLSYDPKVDSLARELGLSAYAENIAEFEAGKLLENFHRLQREHEHCREFLRTTVSAYRARLERLFAQSLR